MPKLKRKVPAVTLLTLRSERDQAEHWLRTAMEDYLERPDQDAAYEIADDYLPRYRAAWMRVRKAERKETRG